MPIQPKQQPPYYSNEGLQIKVYRAIIKQTGTNNPTIIELQNDIGTFTWTRDATGVYNAALSGGITDPNKCILQATLGTQTSTFIVQAGVNVTGIELISIDNTWTNTDIGSFSTEPGVYITLLQYK